MTTREFYVERRKAEHPVFLKVLKALPPDQLSYKPHERSSSAAQVAWTLAWELAACVTAAKEGRAEWRTDPPPPHAEIVSLFERQSNELTRIVEGMDDAAWDAPAKFYYQGKLVNEQPVSQFLWMVHFDAIHHRGQLTAYLRPMGGKVPAIYGPSADDSGR